MSRLGDQSHHVANTDNGVLELSASVGFPLTEHVENHLLSMPRVGTELVGRIVQVPGFCLRHKGSNFKNLCLAEVSWLS